MGMHKHLGKSGFLKSPDKTTFQKYTGFTIMSRGYNYGVIKKIS